MVAHLVLKYWTQLQVLCEKIKFRWVIIVFKIYLCSSFPLHVQDKSSDIEQQPPFGDRKISIYSLKIRGGRGVTKPTGTSYNFDKVWSGAYTNLQFELLISSSYLSSFVFPRMGASRIKEPITCHTEEPRADIGREESALPHLSTAKCWARRDMRMTSKSRIS